jgi:glycerate dehydrogenase
MGQGVKEEPHMKIVVLDGYTLNPGDLSWDGLNTLGDCIVYDRTPAEKVIERIGDAEVVYTNKTVLTKEVFEKAGNLKFVCVLATGYNVVDTEAAKMKGIIVCNIPAYSTDSVAQLACALMLELCHHVGAHSDAVKNGEWTRSADFCFWKYPLIELAGKTIGLVGFGNIGQKVSNIALSLGMKVLYNTRSGNKKYEQTSVKYAELDELFAASDFISLHCPLLDSTKGLINKDSISHMKNGVFIINTSRGPLIVEKDLAEALDSGKVGGAAVDVVSSEPITKDNPLLMAKNCIITPHFAWAPIESRSRLMNVAVDNLKKFIEGDPVNVVNR